MTAVLLAAPSAGPLLGAMLLSIALIVVLIAWFKVHPFVALLLGSVSLSLLAGQAVDQSFSGFARGFGATTASVGILIALGAMIGKLLADSGGADRIVDTILACARPGGLPWAMGLIAFVLGIPLFFEVGLVLLMPVVILVSRRSDGNLLTLGIPALAGLSVLHGLVPPHPGPLIAVHALQANMGLTMILGVLVAIPTVVLAGPVLAGPLARSVRAEAPEALRVAFRGTAPSSRPSFAIALATVLLPSVLMLGRASAESWMTPGRVATALAMVGEPTPAMLIATLFAMLALGRASGMDRGALASSVGASLPPIAGILLIVGAGGGFKQAILDTGIADAITGLAQHASISPLVLGWLLAVLVRLATGSATVATITASGLVAPLAAGSSPLQASLLVLAVGSGSLFLSHLNDAGFWLVKEYFGMSVGQTLRTWSLMETLISVVGLVAVLLISACF